MAKKDDFCLDNKDWEEWLKSLNSDERSEIAFAITRKVGSPAMAKCPKCGKNGFEWDARAKVFTCLYRDCRHTEKPPVAKKIEKLKIESFEETIFNNRHLGSLHDVLYVVIHTIILKQNELIDRLNKEAENDKDD